MGRAFEFRKARKLKRWGNMAKTFTRIGKEVVIAVKAGGSDPAGNARLRALIQNAKAANMPKDNIERAIKRAVSKDQDDYREVTYEGYGPYGIAMIVETATDNPTRTVANIRSYFSRFNGSLGTSGSVEYMFEHQCQFKIRSREDLNLDEFELEMIDYGVQEVFEEDEHIFIYAGFESFGPVQKYLEENGFEIINAEFERIPADQKELNADQAAEIEKLLEKLEEDDDVSHVYHNMK